MDNGVVISGTDYLSVTGPNPVTKLLSDTGLLASNTNLDKTPASGLGAGELDTFSTVLIGQGNTLVLTLSANIPFEAAAFDNIRIEGVAVPEPGSLAFLGVFGAGAYIVRKRRPPKN